MLKHDAGHKKGTKSRAQVARLMNDEIFLCPIADFLSDYGPISVEEPEISTCRDALVGKQVLIRSSSGTKYRWAAYPVSRTDIEGTEPAVLNRVKQIVDAIFTYASTTIRGRGNDYEHRDIPYEPLESDSAGINVNHKMDASLVEKGFATGILPIRSTIVLAEFKQYANVDDQRIVREHIAGDCHHIMCEDPRRMFIYGITIEDDRMSVWYFSRSHSMKSLSFDWVKKDIRTFIQIFLAFAYATPKDLGVDPFVHKAPMVSGEGQQYIYELPMEENPGNPPKIKYFRTIQSLAPTRPYRTSGRMTRVWTVIEVVSIYQAIRIPNASKAMLKDVWLDVERATEAENMDNIFDDIEQLLSDAKTMFPDDNDWLRTFINNDARFTEFDSLTKTRICQCLTNQHYKSLFLTKLHTWKGQVSKSVSEAARFSPRGVDIFPEQLRAGVTFMGNEMPYTSAVQGNSPDAECIAKAADMKLKRGRHTPKQQSRFLYKEICSELRTVGSLGNAMDVLDQALDALRVLFCAGWVHRDISENNILVQQKRGKFKVKVSDLEFAERIGHTEHRTDARTGTPYFMPYEIMSQRYLIDTIRDQDDPLESLAVQMTNTETDSPLYNRLKAFKPIPGKLLRTLPTILTDNVPDRGCPLRYNFQHDLESIWWIVFFLITARVQHNPSHEKAKLIFHNSMVPSLDRTMCFLFSFMDVRPYLHPDLMEPFSVFMQDLRGCLTEQYLIKEVFGQLDIEACYSGVHGRFATKFANLLAENKNNWRQIPLMLNDALHPVKTKRQHDDDTDEANKKPRAGSAEYDVS